MNPRSGNAGFALVETLVAIAILTGVLIATYASLAHALSLAAVVRARQEAVDGVVRMANDARALGPAGVYTRDAETPFFRLRLSVSPVSGATQTPVLPLRIVGRISRKRDPVSAETVLDTIILGRAWKD